MSYSDKILIGGQALRQYGSTRYTDDVDYLIFDENSYKPFLTGEGVDYINGNGSNFFEEIYNLEKGNKIATPKGLMELKAYSLVQHYMNFNPNKINTTKHDISFLIINFKLELPKIVKKYVTSEEYKLIEETFKSVEK